LVVITQLFGLEVAHGVESSCGGDKLLATSSISKD